MIYILTKPPEVDWNSPRFVRRQLRIGEKTFGQQPVDMALKAVYFASTMGRPVSCCTITYGRA